MSKKSEYNFWVWFSENSERIFHFEQYQEKIFDEISSHLYEIDNGLAFELGSIENGKREFIISADGDKKLFPMVKEIVAIAPLMNQWQIIAFRPRGDTSYKLEYNGVALDSDDIWFRARTNRKRVDLVLFMKNYENQKEKDASFLMLDHALGEYDVETKIGVIEWAPLPPDPVASGLLKWSELPRVVDKIFMDFDNGSRLKD